MLRTPTRTSTEQPVASARRRPRRHPASLRGFGGSNSIDDLVPRPVRDWRDANTDWNDDASDGTLEERLCWPSGGCQNWRHDVVALVTSGGALRERVRYTAYGIPVGMPQGDCDGDGDVDAADQSILLGAWGTATTKCDLNLDGTVDAADNAILLGQLGATAGFGRLSLSGNRFGYAGYASDPAVHADWHVRHRVLMAELGRWSRRDPAGTDNLGSLYGAMSASPAGRSDPSGLTSLLIGPQILQWMVGRCEASRAACRSDPAVEAKLAEIVNCSAGRWTADQIWSRVACEYCPSYGYFAHSNNCSGPGSVGLCVGKFGIGDTNCATVLHELTHMLQFCRWCRKHPNEPYPDSPQLCLCREIEAYGAEPGHPCGHPEPGFDTAVACCESACRSCLPNYESHFCDQGTCVDECSMILLGRLCGGIMNY